MPEEGEGLASAGNQARLDALGVWLIHTKNTFLQAPVCGLSCAMSPPAFTNSSSNCCAFRKISGEIANEPGSLRRALLVGQGESCPSSNSR